jgi:two-component system phosphate regulon sensor histidine kinase PhoR
LPAPARSRGRVDRRGAIIAHHIWYLDRLELGLRFVGAPVPEGRGAWRMAFSALHRRSRARTAHERDLADTLERFRNAVEAIPDGMTMLDSGNRIGWANHRAQAHWLRSRARRRPSVDESGATAGDHRLSRGR